MLAHCFRRKSNMSGPVLLNLLDLNDLRKSDKMLGLLSILLLYAMSLINSKIEARILDSSLSNDIKNYFKITFLVQNSMYAAFFIDVIT